ncbi:MAG: response regulator [Acidobacteria bacterium]|nr:response regulator [Acidobacteriota bacterium]
MLQTRDGYIWLATGAGLVRFDGVRFTVFDKTNTPAIRDDDVRALAEDQEGNVWIGTYSGGLTRMNSAGFTFYGEKESGLPSEMIRGLYVDRSGSLWISTFGGGLSRFRDGKFTTLTTADGLADDKVKTVIEDRAGALWVGTYSGGVSRIAGGEITNFTTDDGLPAMFVLDILEDSSGAIWFATYGGGMARLQGGRFTVLSVDEGLGDSRVVALEEDRDGNLWIGLYGGGVQRLTDGEFTGFTPADGLTGDLVFDLMEDREGSLWIGSFNGGLDQLRDEPFTTFTSREGLTGDIVFSVSAARKGGVWVGIEGGGVNRVREGEVEAIYTSRQGLSSDNVVAVLEDRRGDVWIGTFDARLHRLRGGQLSSDTAVDEIGDDHVWCIYEDADGVIWLGTRTGGVIRYDGRDFSRLTSADGLVGNGVRAVHKDRSGVIWIGTDSGVSRLVGERIENITRADGLPTDAIVAFHEDAEGVIWIGTRGGGLSRWEDGEMFNFSRSNGLPDDSIFRILEDDQGNLWMSSLRGVFRVSRTELNEFAAGDRDDYDSNLYDTADGMEDSQTAGGSQPAGAKAADGSLWFPTVKGVVRVDPDSMPENDVPPPVYIEQLIVDRKAYPLGETTLPAGSRNIEIHYTAPSFQAPEKMRFLYRLEGFDPEWVDAGPRRIAYYTNLSPGSYRFSVQAFNSDNVASEGIASTSFEIGRLFYQTLWFYLSIAAVLATFTFLIVRGRLSVIRAEADARAANLERSLIESQKMEALGQMASGVAHDFNNTMMTALPWADILARQYPDIPLVQKAARNIHDSVIRARGVTRQLLDFAQPKKPEMRPVDLASLLENHLQLIRPSLSPEIKIDLDSRGTDLIVLADPDQIQQAILNLSLNARDAMPRGGTLQFKVRPITRREIEEWNLDLADGVVLSISDTGTGIEQSRRLHVFDPFFTTKEVGKGTGLGLAVVHRIIEEHGGKIVLDSPRHGGTVFHIILPAYQASPEQAPPEQPARQEGGKLSGLRIVIIDDEVELAEGVKMMLEMDGAEVVLRGSGVDALAEIDAGLQPDLIILDLGMPGMTGDEVHAEVRKRFPLLPLLISSGYGDRARLDPLLADGHTRFKQKPYTLDELIDEIVRWVQPSKANAASRRGE